MKKTLFAGIAAVALVTGACSSSTFLVHKGGKAYYLGNESKTMEAMICDSGDLKKILSGTELTKQMKTDLYRYNCSAEKSGKQVKEIYALMTPGQRKGLRVAFKENGYDINYRPCCGAPVD